MNEIITFSNEEIGSVRTMMIDGEPWFVGKDVTNTLGYGNSRQAIITNVDDEDKGVYSMDTPGGKQKITMINESGLYSLILSSKLPTAKKFKKWVTSEILPSIRKTGAYSVQEKPDSYLIEDPAERARRWAEEYEEKVALMNKIEEDKPLVDFASQIQESTNSVDMNTMAKIISKNGIKIGRNKLFALLRCNNILMMNNVPYQQYINNEWFEVKEYSFKKNNKIQTTTMTLVKPKGQIGIAKLVNEIYN